jgi:hypothetical protein
VFKRRLADAAALARLGTRLTCKNIKEEGLHVIVERLVIKEELGEQAEILAVHFIVLSIDLEDGQIVVTVDLVARRVSQIALALVPLERLGLFHVLEAELAHVELVLAQVEAAVAVGVGRIIPRVYLVATEFDAGDVLHLRDLLVLLLQRSGRRVEPKAAPTPTFAPAVVAVLPLHSRLARFLPSSVDVFIRGAPTNAISAHPLVEAAIICGAT